MGQYYHVYVLPDPEHSQSWPNFKRAEIFTPDGIKLMEHSWLGNTSVDKVMEFLVDNPSSVAWLGDYSNDAKNNLNGHLTPDEFISCYNAAWSDDGWAQGNAHRKEVEEMTREEVMALREDMADAYIINESKHQVISLKKYAELHWEKFKLEKEKSPDGHWFEHPLPLLTACGNGMGGGDFYNKKNIGYKNVGVWAFDTIRIDFIQPSGYSDVTAEYLFREVQFGN